MFLFCLPGKNVLYCYLEERSTLLPMYFPMPINTLQATTTWHNVDRTGKMEIEWLRKAFAFHPLDLEDCAGSAQRPKLSIYQEYLFMILLFPVYNKHARAIEQAEIDFFINEHFLITVHRNEFPVIKRFYEELSASDTVRTRFLGENSAVLLYEILDRLLEYCFPMLDHTDLDIKNIEMNIFTGNEKQMVGEILTVKTSIVNFRNTMSAHRNIIKNLMKANAKFFDTDTLKVYYQNLVDLTVNIWDILAAQRETIDALHATNESLISFRLNQVMKTLTIFSVIVFPLTLLAAIFGMNAVDMPLVNSRYGFWYIVTIMLVGTIGMFTYFKRKGWLK